MNIHALKALRARPFFTLREAARAFNLPLPSARVLGTRYVGRGIFRRLRRDMYVLEEGWNDRPRESYFRIANLLQTPSYVSLLSALSFHEVTTQVPRGVVESISQKRTARYTAGNQEFRFYRIQQLLYFGFEQRHGFFIATPEKALLDSLYLASCGKYALDTHALDCRRLDRPRLRQFLKKYPPRTRQWTADLCRI